VETKDLARWQDFEREVEILNHRGNDVLGTRKARLLFRGQADSSWPLSTTLERRAGTSWKWQTYLRLARVTLPQVQPMTEREWQLPEHAATEPWGSSYDDTLKSIPAYDYWIYLRHHGFPSPLFDWSRSPYVAAFFAFRVDCRAERVAIYCYQQYVTGGKVSSSNKPSIQVHGPYVNTHRRHILQQCEYTTCSVFNDNAWSYAKHSDVFAEGEPEQDLLWKFTLPASERLGVLKRLNDFNLNAFSLFPTEDALLETVALRELDFRGGWT
jgi:FRG domain